MEEIWKEIKGHNNYQISNLGRIKSLNYKRSQKERILKPSIFNNGYYMITLNGKKKLIHRLVAETFIPNPENKPVVNHKDNNKLNNNVENLEWCSHKENTIHAVKIGVYKSRDKMLSVVKPRAKTVLQFDLEGNLLNKFYGTIEAEQHLKNNNIKANARNIRKACCGEYKTSSGYVWRYE